MTCFRIAGEKQFNCEVVEAAARAEAAFPETSRFISEALLPGLADAADGFFYAGPKSAIQYILGITRQPGQTGNWSDVGKAYQNWKWTNNVATRTLEVGANILGSTVDLCSAHYAHDLAAWLGNAEYAPYLSPFPQDGRGIVRDVAGVGLLAAVPQAAKAVKSSLGIESAANSVANGPVAIELLKIAEQAEFSAAVARYRAQSPKTFSVAAKSPEFGGIRLPIPGWLQKFLRNDPAPTRPNFAFMGALTDKQGQTVPVLHPDSLVSDMFLRDLKNYRAVEERLLLDSIVWLEKSKATGTIVVYGPSGAGKTHAIVSATEGRQGVTVSEFSPLTQYKESPGVNILSVTVPSDEALSVVLNDAGITAKAVVPFYAKPLTLMQIMGAAREKIEVATVESELAPGKLVFFRDPRGIEVKRPLSRNWVIVKSSDNQLLHDLLKIRERHPSNVDGPLEHPAYMGDAYTAAVDWYHQLGAVANMNEAALSRLIQSNLAAKDSIGLGNGFYDPKWAVNATRLGIIAHMYDLHLKGKLHQWNWTRAVDTQFLCIDLRHLVEQLVKDAGIDGGRNFRIQYDAMVDGFISFMKNKIDRNQLPPDYQRAFDFLVN